MKSNRANLQSGVILIEALVAILIFAIGILALIGLQAAAIANTAEAKYRSDAALLASQLITRVWIDDKANIPNYDTSSGGAANNSALTAWKAEVKAALPQATGANAPTVSVVSNAGGFDIVVTVKWHKPGQPDKHQFVSAARIDHNT